jgi:Cyclin, N-terminal domain/Cyclin, C-terminal domain
VGEIRDNTIQDWFFQQQKNWREKKIQIFEFFFFFGLEKKKNLFGAKMMLRSSRHMIDNNENGLENGSARQKNINGKETRRQNSKRVPAKERGALRDVSTYANATTHNSLNSNNGKSNMNRNQSKSASTRLAAAKKSRSRNDGKRSSTTAASERLVAQKLARQKQVRKARRLSKQRQQQKQRDSNDMVDDSAQQQQDDEEQQQQASSSSISAAVVRPSNVPDLDDTCDPMMVGEYACDVVNYLQAKELRDRVNPDYILRQVDISQAMRRLLVHWMIEVADEFQLKSETLALSVQLLDQFMQRKKVPRAHFQLAGVTALLIASKYEEVWPPLVSDFEFISDNTFSKADILDLETSMFETLKYNVGFVTAQQFVERFCRAGDLDKRLLVGCRYFLELALTEYDALNYLPSELGAASVHLCRRLAGKQPLWTPALEHYTGYEEEHLREPIRALERILAREALRDTQHFVSQKYATAEVHQISSIVLKYYRSRALARRRKQQQQDSDEQTQT